jgi:hypothetical protein
VGTIVRASGSLQLERPGEAARRVEPAEAQGLRLWPGDVVATDDAEAWLETGGARVQVGRRSRLSLRGAEGGPALRLLGDGTIDTEGQVAVGVVGGEVGLLRGEAALHAGDDGTTHVLLRRGTAGVRLGDEVSAALLAPAELEASRPDGRKVRLSVPPGAQPVDVTAGALDVRLGPQRALVHGRTGDTQTIELWGGARLELSGPLRAQVVAGSAEQELLRVAGLGDLPLVPGVYRLARGADGRVEVLSLPSALGAPDAYASATSSPPSPAPTPTTQTGPALGPSASASAPPAAAPRVPVAADETVTLSNGAVLTTRGWGKLSILHEGPQDVVVESPGGSLSFGPATRATLSRRRELGVDLARVETPDGRWVEQEAGAGPSDVWLQGDGRLRVLVRGDAAPRTIEVEPGCAFDLTIRRDRYVLANVFGQLVYVDGGQQVSVTRKGGLRVRDGR